MRSPSSGHAAARDRAQRAALAGQLRAAYLIGRQEPLKLLLVPQDPLRSARLFAYYGYFGRARASQIAQIQQHVQRARCTRRPARAAAAAARLRSRRSSRDSCAAWSACATNASSVLASLESQTQTREASLARLKVQQADLERLLRRLNRSLPEVAPPDITTAFGRLRGQLNWPVAGRSRPNTARRAPAASDGTGCVVATERDAPVKAVTAGRVVYADWLPGLGLLAIIDHGEGYLSLYGHNDRLL